MKKLVSLILALCMLASLAVVAHADDPVGNLLREVQLVHGQDHCHVPFPDERTKAMFFTRLAILQNADK